MLLSGKTAEYKPNDYKSVDSVEAISQQTAELTKETANFMAQFQKNLAAESIKNAVGVIIIIINLFHYDRYLYCTYLQNHYHM